MTGFRVRNLLKGLLLLGTVLSTPASASSLMMHDIPTNASLPLTQQLSNGWTYALGDAYTCGIQVVLPWSLVNTANGVYDWSQVDALIAQWSAKGQYVEITWTSTAETPGQLYGKSDTPAWVISALKGDTFTCTTVGDPTAPNYLDPVYQADWRAFITAFMTKYASNPWIASVHFDLGAGESSPASKPDSACYSLMAKLKYPITAGTWTPYALAQVKWVHDEAIKLSWPSQIPWDLNDQGALEPTSGGSFMSQVGGLANSLGMMVENDGFGFDWGTQGINDSHTAMFEQGGALYPFQPLWQAETASVANQQGYSSFPSILAEATDLGISRLHVYAQEWSIAYNSGDKQYAQYGASYRNALATGVSGPSCRTTLGNP